MKLSEMVLAPGDRILLGTAGDITLEVLAITDDEVTVAIHGLEEWEVSLEPAPLEAAGC